MADATTPTITQDDDLGLPDLDAGREDLALDLPGGAPAALTADQAQVPDGGSPVATRPAQHGLNAHSHGAGVPATNRAERRTSFDAADFAVPTGREEEWRFTPLDRARALFEPAGAAASGLRVQVSAAPGVEHRRTTDTARASGKGYVPGDRAAAVAWADAAASGAVDVVSVKAEADLADPVVVTVSSADPSGRAAGHLVVQAGPYSRATVVVDHTGGGSVASGVEAVVGEGAHLTLVSLHQWDSGAVHLAQHDLLVGRDATLKHVVVTLGGSLVRVGSTVRYDGPGGDATLLGVYFADAGQHLEHRSFVDHEAPSCRSNVTYKGALQGQTARTVWVGDVLIRASALSTDTYELNRNLVLTEGARADSVPNLEIETGEIVGAGHASATGRFDDEQLFYLQSRGIPSDQARRMVVRAFFADVVQQIGVPAVVDQVMGAIEAELELAERSTDTAA